MNNLANAFSDKGDLDKAIEIYENTLALRKQVLGDTHPDTLTSMNNLANAFSDKGDLDKAIEI